jgi:hypothetical protein
MLGHASGRLDIFFDCGSSSADESALRLRPLDDFAAALVQAPARFACSAAGVGNQGLGIAQPSHVRYYNVVR